jgi:hypothetical protein
MLFREKILSIKRITVTRPSRRNLTGSGLAKNGDKNLDFIILFSKPRCKQRKELTHY